MYVIHMYLVCCIRGREPGGQEGLFLIRGAEPPPIGGCHEERIIY